MAEGGTRLEKSRTHDAREDAIYAQTNVFDEEEGDSDTEEIFTRQK